jgi:hypothetical protein
MGRLRGRVAGAPTPAECAKLTSVVQALDIRHGGMCAHIFRTQLEVDPVRSGSSE